MFKLFSFSILTLSVHGEESEKSHAHYI